MNGQSQEANYTLNLLCGREGFLYANTVPSGADTIDFLNFWSEAVDYVKLNWNYDHKREKK